MSVASAAMVATGSTYMAITVPFLIITICVLQHVYLQTSRQIRLLDLECKSPVYSQFIETLNGLTTIRAFGWQDAFKRENHKLLDHSQRPHYVLSCIQRWLTLVLDLVVTTEAVIVIALALNLRHTTSIGLLGVSLNSILGRFPARLTPRSPVYNSDSCSLQ
jgi:ATP-binding cassette, subfamily C (CFTR/MRP), member 1